MFRPMVEQMQNRMRNAMGPEMVTSPQRKHSRSFRMMMLIIDKYLFNAEGMPDVGSLLASLQSPTSITPGESYDSLSFFHEEDSFLLQPSVPETTIPISNIPDRNKHKHDALFLNQLKHNEPVLFSIGNEPSSVVDLPIQT